MVLRIVVIPVQTTMVPPSPSPPCRGAHCGAWPSQAQHVGATSGFVWSRSESRSGVTVQHDCGRSGSPSAPSRCALSLGPLLPALRLQHSPAAIAS